MKQDTLNIKVPTSWQQLTDCQLLYFFRQLATDKPMAEIQTLCLCQWANILVRCRLYAGVYLVQHAKQQAVLTLHQFVCAITTLDYLKSFPLYPVRIRKIGKATAIAADFQGVPFSTFISTDNYYQGFLHTHNTELLRDAATLLYPRIKRKHLTTAHCLSIFYWLASLKQYLARLFPHFLTPCASTPTNLLGDTQSIADKVRSAMNAQIRALTGGDITKEQAVLAMDTWRALTELDAKAKEAEEIRKTYH